MSKHFLNIIPLEVVGSHMEVGEIKNSSFDLLKKLRKENYKTHSFMYKGSNVIRSFPLHSTSVPIGEKTQISVIDNLDDVCFVVNDRIVSFLKENGFKVLKFADPIIFYKNDTILKKVASEVSQSITLPDWIKLVTVCELYVRIIEGSNKTKRISLVCNIRNSPMIQADCEKLLAANINIVGKYISSKKRRIIGKVLKIEGDKIFLEDTNSELSEVSSKDCFLEERMENFEHCLFSLLGDKYAELVLKRLKAYTVFLRNGKNKLEKIQKSFSIFNNLNLDVAPGVKVSSNGFLEELKPLFPKMEILPSPTFLFDQTLNRVDTYSDRGLNLHGPYDQKTFPVPNPRVAIICQANKKGQVEQFLNKFLEGLPNTKTQNGNGFAPYGKGFYRKYKTNSWDIKIFTTKDDSHNEYNRAIEEAIEDSSVSNKKWNLVMVQIEDFFEELPYDKNPYLTTKAKLFTHNIPSQDFKIETISKVGLELAYTLNQMSLATYAKLGGTPWLLTATPAVAHELIFGMGSVMVGKGRFAQKERMVGITTVFKGDGEYLFENRSKAVGKSEYQEEILRNLKKTVEKLKELKNWQEGESIRLIFHAFKPFKNTEVEAVKKLMEEITPLYKVEYAFIHVVQDHPYLLFDRGQVGNYGKGEYSPTRGKYLKINDYESLVSLIGYKEVKKAEDGMPYPVLLKLHKDSTFFDMTYLSRQVYFLSSHSWRSFFPSSMPISILYSKLIADLLGQLSQLPKWDPSVMIGFSGKSRWFL